MLLFIASSIENIGKYLKKICFLLNKKLINIKCKAL